MLIPILAVLWIGMVALVEEMQTFSVVAQPVLGLALLGVAISTMIIRTIRELGRVRDQAWWWVSLGLIVSFGTTVAFAPAAYLLLETAPQLLIRAYEVRAALTVFAFLLLTRGMFARMPGRRGHSGSSHGLHGND